MSSFIRTFLFFNRFSKNVVFPDPEGPHISIVNGRINCANIFDFFFYVFIYFPYISKLELSNITKSLNKLFTAHRTGSFLCILQLVK